MYILSGRVKWRERGRLGIKRRKPRPGFLEGKDIAPSMLLLDSISLKGDLQGASRLPHFMFLPRYFLLIFKHTSQTEREETCSSWTSPWFKCWACGNQLAMWAYHTQKEAALSQIVFFPRPSALWLWSFLSKLSLRSPKKMCGPSARKKGARHAKMKHDKVQETLREGDKSQWVKICRQICTCVCWIWHVLYDLWRARTHAR